MSFEMLVLGVNPCAVGFVEYSLALGQGERLGCTDFRHVQRRRVGAQAGRAKPLRRRFDDGTHVVPFEYFYALLILVEKA